MIINTKNSTKLSQLNTNQYENLSLEELIGRMDAVRYCAWQDRYNSIPEIFRDTLSPFRSLTEFLITKRAQELEEQERRHLAKIAFQYLFQNDLITTTWGISNKVVYPKPYDEEIWAFPRQWFRYSALEQYQIISSRILLENFFDLIHFVISKKTMDGNSKFRCFRKWVVQPNNPFQCFIPDMINAYKYDRVHRHNEIHGKTRFVDATLRLEVPTQPERSIPYPLTRIVHKLYDALIEIMDYKVPQSENPIGITVSYSGTDEVINHFKNDGEFFIQEMTKFATDKNLSPLPEMIIKKASEMSEVEKQKMAQSALLTKFVEMAQAIASSADTEQNPGPDS